MHESPPNSRFFVLYCRTVQQAVAGLTPEAEGAFVQRAILIFLATLCVQTVGWLFLEGDGAPEAVRGPVRGGADGGRGTFVRPSSCNNKQHVSVLLRLCRALSVFVAWMDRTDPTEVARI